MARSVDVYAAHLKEVLGAAARHKGTAFVEIFQNCNIFNDGAWEPYREKELRDDNLLHLRHGQPLIFGKNADKGIRMRRRSCPRSSDSQTGRRPRDLVVHDEKAPAAYAFMLAQMEAPAFPVPVGVYRNVEAPIFDAAMHAQVEQRHREEGPGRPQRADLRRRYVGGPVTSPA